MMSRAKAASRVLPASLLAEGAQGFASSVERKHDPRREHVKRLAKLERLRLSIQDIYDSVHVNSDLLSMLLIAPFNGILCKFR